MKLGQIAAMAVLAVVPLIADAQGHRYQGGFRGGAPMGRPMTTHRMAPPHMMPQRPMAFPRAQMDRQAARIRMDQARIAQQRNRFAADEAWRRNAAFHRDADMRQERAMRIYRARRHEEHVARRGYYNYSHRPIVYRYVTGVTPRWYPVTPPNEWFVIANDLGYGDYVTSGNWYDPSLVFEGTYGAPYEYTVFERDQYSPDWRHRLRWAYFNRPYFYRAGHRYDRITFVRNGRRFYEFKRVV